MTELLSELDFSLDMPSDGVVESRNEVVIDSSAPSHSATNNNIIRLYMTSSGFVDPHTVQIFADVSYPTVTAQTAANVIPGCHFFSDVRVLSQRGDVLEELNNTQLLSQKLHEASSDADYMNCGGSFTNSQKDVSLRQVALSAAPVNFRMNITDVLGIFNQPKYLHMASFGGGLQIELRCGSNESVMTTKDDTVAAQYSLSNVRLHYEEVLVSRGYMDLYNEKLQQGGYALSFPTHSHLQSPVTAGGETQIALNKTASKVKYVFSTVRESANRNKIDKNETATDSRVVSYQYQINGKNFPPQAVRSKAKAYQELLEANGNHKDNRTALICYKDFNEQWEFGASKTSETIQNGTYAAWMNLEKSASSALSGTGMTANSSFLKINVDAAVASPVVDTFVCFSRVLSVQPDRVVIVD